MIPEHLHVPPSAQLPVETSDEVCELDDEKYEVQLRREEWAIRRECITAARRALQRYVEGDPMNLQHARAFLVLASELGQNAIHPKRVRSAERKTSLCDPKLIAVYNRQLDLIYNNSPELLAEKLAIIPEEEPTV